jgi:hypothetical protein
LKRGIANNNGVNKYNAINAEDQHEEQAHHYHEEWWQTH